MLNIQKLSRKPKVFQRLTGLTPIQFHKLLKKLEPLYKEAEANKIDITIRKRKVGGGRKKKLTLDQNLFLLLLYYRVYVNHVFIGIIGGIDDSNVGRYFAKIDYLLARIFKIPEKKVKMSEDEILELIIDATEQESEKRPGSGYSGKKKSNTVKTQIAINPEGKVKSVSKTVKGNMHDKKLYDKTRITTDRKVKRKSDLGYIGTACQTPIKKPKNRELTEKEKKYNKQFSKERIIVEHVFAHLKKFKILSYRFRNPVKKHNLIFKNIAGIRNFITA